MRWVNRVLLSSAASLVAVAGAQAADLPVKAKPIEYVKVCSAYGSGFYYIPGADICLRVGGYTWTDIQYNHRGASALITPGQLLTDGGFSHIKNRNVNDISWRSRAMFIMDARQASPIGTVRTYISMGMQKTTNATGASGAAGDFAVYTERAFIQFAGFTAGYSASFFDAWSSFSVTTPNSLANRLTSVFAYTAQFGGGFSATLSIEDGQSHRNAITNVAYAATATALGTNVYGGQLLPDFVGNLRVDQPWGLLQLSGALHQLPVNQALVTAGVGDDWGWAAAASAAIKLPMLGSGDELRLQAIYTKGAVEYNGVSASGDSVAVSLGQRTGPGFGIGPVFDLFDSFAAAGSQHLVTAWSATAQFQHWWNPMLRSAVFGGSLKIEMPALATAAGYPNFELWQLGFNTIWSPAKNLDITGEINYTYLATNCANLAPAACAADATRGKNKGIVGAVLRTRMNF